MAGRRRGTESRVRRRQSRDLCDSDAFVRPRARRALTGLQGLDARPCPTPPGPSAGSVAGSCTALVTVCCGRKVGLFTSLHAGHVVWSNCEFSVLSGPGELYYVPIAYTNTSRRSGELLPDLHQSSRSDFGLSARIGGGILGTPYPRTRAGILRTRYPEDTAVSWGYRILRIPLASWGYRGILRMPLVSCG